MGGSQQFPDSDNSCTGVLAQGGRQLTESNTDRLPHGAGVVALAGGAGPGAKPVPPLTDTGGVGVFGQGADAEVQMVLNPDGTTSTVPAGPRAPGPGVLGRGGIPTGPQEEPSIPAAGVIGLAGGTAMPPVSDTEGNSKTGNNGVFGKGPTGVFGWGVDGRGGQFKSDKSAQVQLIPRRLDHPLPLPVPVTVTAIPILGHEGIGPALPKDGLGGDLMAVVDDQRQCTLWFCVKSSTVSPPTPAQWAQVLLGSSFDERA